MHIHELPISDVSEYMQITW